MKTNIKLFLFPFFIYLGIGIYKHYTNLLMLISLSLFFSLNVYFSCFILKFINSITVEATIVDAIYGQTDMVESSSNRYYIKYNLYNKDFISRINYSTSSNYEIGEKITILISKDNTILVKKDLYFFIILNIIFFMILIFFLFKG